VWKEARDKTAKRKNATQRKDSHDGLFRGKCLLWAVGFFNISGKAESITYEHHVVLFWECKNQTAGLRGLKLLA